MDWPPLTSPPPLLANSLLSFVGQPDNATKPGSAQDIRVLSQFVRMVLSDNQTMKPYTVNEDIFAQYIFFAHFAHGLMCAKI